MAALQYFESLPSGKFQDVVQNYWMFKFRSDSNRTAPFFLKTLPQTSISIVCVNQPRFIGIRMLGPQRRSYEQEILPGSTFMGIRLNPWIRPLSPYSGAQEILDKTTELPAELMGHFSKLRLDHADQLDAGRIESTLTETLGRNQFHSDELTKFVCLLLLKGRKINELLTEVPISLRPLQRHFKLTTGLTMTELRNIARLERTMKQIYFQNESIFSASLVNGYADHSHFIHSFKKYTKSTVSDFLIMTDMIKLKVD